MQGRASPYALRCSRECWCDLVTPSVALWLGVHRRERLSGSGIYRDDPYQGLGLDGLLCPRVPEHCRGGCIVRPDRSCRYVLMDWNGATACASVRYVDAVTGKAFTRAARAAAALAAVHGWMGGHPEGGCGW